jgi:exodeoxyribonuclease V alpha subunit
MPDLKLDIDQQRVIDEFRQHKLLIITGGPGRGKTAIITELCNILDSEHTTYALCAPTGKAAKRMAELTKRPASTIHRLLKAGYGRWTYNKNNRLHTYKYVICDETSMLDLELMWHLLQAFPDYTKFIFVGDIDQLPSVGPGTILRDLCRSGIIPTYRLTINHRQGLGSLIAHNATLVNEGKMKFTFGDDIVFIEANDPITIREKISNIIQGFKKLNYDLIKDVQVLTPQHKTKIGVAELNDMLRYSINPSARPTEKFSVGDKVMQTVNNYNLKIFNGYIGRIIESNYWEKKIEFFDGEDVNIIRYPKDNEYELMLAYACTIHKYQGSEVKAGIIVLSASHTFMWNRNLLYTAMTRFKERCVILGDAATFKKAIMSSTENVRNSKLMDRLHGRL